NVLGNAVKYTPAGGTVQVRVQEQISDDRTWGTIVVSDSGPGIPPDKLQSIFRPYYRIQTDDESGPEGTGLGLAIARELVRRMGGDIDVASDAPTGATFTLRLPTPSPGEEDGG